MSDIQPHPFRHGDDDLAHCIVCGFPVGNMLHVTPKVDDIAVLKAGVSTLEEIVRGLRSLPDEIKGLRSDLHDARRQTKVLEGQIDRYREEGTGVQADITRIIDYAAANGYEQVCISSPERNMDGSWGGWVITLGKGEG